MLRSFALRPVSVPQGTLSRLAELQPTFHKLFTASARDTDFIHATFDRMRTVCAWTVRELAVYERVSKHAASKPLLLLPNSVYLQQAAPGAGPVVSCNNVQAGEPYQLQLVGDLQRAEQVAAGRPAESVRPVPLAAACRAVATAARLVHPSRPCVALLAKPTDRMALRTRIDLRGVGETLRRDHGVDTVYVSMADLARSRLDASGDLLLGERRISVVYSRYDFSHPWGRWVEQIPAGGGSAPTEELLAECARHYASTPLLPSPGVHPFASTTRPAPHGLPPLGLLACGRLPNQGGARRHCAARTLRAVWGLARGRRFVVGVVVGVCGCGWGWCFL